MKQARTFEQDMERLEAIVRRLEGGELPLDEAVALYQEGVGLCAANQSRLEQVEQQVTLLRRELDGTLREEPFEAAAPEDE